uniref:Uncharacterized protein n=1 Tax=Myotis myotis TaxID=51298 RepID=A0A7J7TIB7_MYOMY|nr:hypothetical protein mMyoMyo1_009029 [Myotis myotis]
MIQPCLCFVGSSSDRQPDPLIVRLHIPLIVRFQLELCADARKGLQKETHWVKVTQARSGCKCPNKSSSCENRPKCRSSLPCFGTNEQGPHAHVCHLQILSQPPPSLMCPSTLLNKASTAQPAISKGRGERVQDPGRKEGASLLFISLQLVSVSEPCY